jgi:hypothetical protein
MKACNERYLETVIGCSGLISAVAFSLEADLRLPDGHEKRGGAPEPQGSVNNLNISFYAFLLSQISVHRF